MPLFKDLDWQPHPDPKAPPGTRLAQVAFANGWTASFLDGDCSIYMKRGVYEILPLTPQGDMPESGDLEGGPFHGDAPAMQLIMNLIERQP